MPSLPFPSSRPKDTNYLECVRLGFDELLYRHFKDFADQLDQRLVRHEQLIIDGCRARGKILSKPGSLPKSTSTLKFGKRSMDSLTSSSTPLASAGFNKEDESLETPRRRTSHAKDRVSEKGIFAQPLDTPKSGETSQSQVLASRRLTALDRTTTLSQRYCPQLARVVLSRDFEIFIGAVIILNCLILGLEAELLLGRAGDFRLTADIAEHIVTAVFVAEILLRLLISGFRFYAPVPGNFMNAFDAALVLVTGVVVVWVMPLFRIDSNEVLRALSVLRAFRLARLVRVLANFDLFHEVWLLLRGLMESGRVLFSTVVVIFIITYIFAIFGVTLISVPMEDAYADLVDPAMQEINDLKELCAVTAGVLPLMFTLIQVLTLDSWTGIARPMMKYVPWCWLYFYLYIAFAVIVMMNLVTAVIVDNALKNSQKDANELVKKREKEAQAKLGYLQRVFEDMDVDGDGELSWLEFESAFEDEELSNELKLLGVAPEKCREIFNLLDSGDGVLTIEEFFDGLTHMEGGAQAKELLKANRQIELIVKMLCQQNDELREDLDEVLHATPGARMSERTDTFKNRSHRRRISRISKCDRESARSSGRSTPTTFSKGGSGCLNTARLANTIEIADQVGADNEWMLGDVVGRLEIIVGDVVGRLKVVDSSKDDLRGSLDACVRRVVVCSRSLDSLLKDMGEFKACLANGSAKSFDGTLEHEKMID